MMRHITALFLVATFFIAACGNSDGAILIYNSNGTYSVSTATDTLEEAATAATVAGKTVVVTSPQTLTANIAWPTDRELRFEKGGYIVPNAYSLTGLKEARPEWWGGISGDDTADTAAIQYAINALIDYGVLHNSGEYIIGSSLTGKSNITIEGGKWTLAASYANQSQGISLTDLTNVTFKDMILDGNMANQGITDTTDNKQNGVAVLGSTSGVSFKNVHFKNFGKDGAYIQTTGSNISFDPFCKFENIRRNGITVIQGKDISVSGSQFYGGYDMAYPVINTGVWYEPDNNTQHLQGLTITGCSFRDLRFGTGIYNANQATVTNVTLSGNNYNNITVGSGVTVYIANDVSVTGNTFKSCGGDASSSVSTRGGAISAENSSGLVLSGNTYNDCGGYYSTVYLGPSCSSPTITGNKHRLDRKHGVFAEYVFDSTTSGSFRIINGNNFTSGGTVAANTYSAVYLNDTATHINNGDILEGNTFSTGITSGYGTAIYAAYGSPVIGRNAYVGTGKKLDFVTSTSPAIVGSASSIPTTGIFRKGDRVENSNPTVGQPKVWISTVAGGAVSTTRANSTAYSLGVWATWTTGTTVWEVTTAGTSDASPPSIVGKVVGDTVIDGTATWTMRSLTTATLTSEGNL